MSTDLTRRELSPGQLRRQPSPRRRDWSPGDDVQSAGNCPGLEVISRGGFRPARPPLQDVPGRHYSPPAYRKVYGEIRPAPSPPATSLEASRSILARSGQGAAAGDGLADCKALHSLRRAGAIGGG